MLDEEPVFAIVARAATHPHERPASGQLLAEQAEFQFAVFQAAHGIFFGFPHAAVPDHDGAAAILPFRNDALEV